MKTGAPGGITLQQSSNLNPLAGCNFPDNGVDALLKLLGLPVSTPLSILAVEVLPGEAHLTAGVASSVALAATGDFEEDPLGSQLGKRRILRTSPLVAVPSVC